MNPDTSKTLPLSEVPPDSTLAAPILGADGQVLVGAGSKLTETTLGKLADRGVLEATIEVQRDETALQQAREVLRQRLQHQFRGCDLGGERNAAQILYQAVLDYRLEALK